MLLGHDGVLLGYGEARVFDDFEVSSVFYGALPTCFGGASEVVHLASGDIVEVEVGVVAGEALEVAVELDHGFGEEDALIVLWSAVGMELYEEPVGALWDLDACFEPEGEAVDVGGLGVLNAAVFDMWHEAPAAAAPVEDEGSLDEHEGIACGSGADIDAAVVCSGAAGIAGGVVDAVDFAGLSAAGDGGEGEVGIAAGLGEDVEFVGDTTG